MPIFLALPTEIKLAIFELLDDTCTSDPPTPHLDIYNLGLVCKAFRELALPSILKSVTLINDDRSGQAVRAIQESDNAKLVHRLHYIGIKPIKPSPEVGYDPDDYEDPKPEDVPDSVEHVLAHLGQFPKLEQVVMEFRGAKDVEEAEDMLTNSFTFENDETDEQTLIQESEDAFRSTMNRSYLALARNPTNVINDLELKNAITYPCSAFGTPEFRTMLQNLISFKLSLRSADNGAGWCANTSFGYSTFIERLDDFFFGHLDNVLHFSFSSKDGPAGLSGSNHAPLPLHAQHMPKLEILCMEEFFVNEGLSAFIANHKQTLKMVDLKNCYSGIGCGLADNPISWGAFFDNIAAHAKGSTLTGLTVSSNLQLLCPEMRSSEIQHRQDEAAQAVQLRAAHPDRRMFDYATIDDKYGMLFENEEQGFEMFLAGHDNAAWLRLQDILRDNK